MHFQPPMRAYNLPKARIRKFTPRGHPSLRMLWDDTLNLRDSRIRTALRHSSLRVFWNDMLLNLRDSSIRTALQQTPFSTCLLAHRVYINECIQILFKHCFNSIQIYPQILICSQRSVQLPHHSQTPIVGFALQRYKLFFTYARKSTKKRQPNDCLINLKIWKIWKLPCGIGYAPNSMAVRCAQASPPAWFQVSGFRFQQAGVRRLSNKSS